MPSFENCVRGLVRGGGLVLLCLLTACPAGEFFVGPAIDEDGDGERVADGDCNDLDPTINTAASEICDEVDNDCDGEIDGLDTDIPDADGDGARACDDCDDNNALAGPIEEETCDGFDTDCDGSLLEGEEDADGDGRFLCAEDCDDSDPDTYGGADEICDGTDNDCDGVLPSDEVDADADDFFACEGDCNDDSPIAYPGATELCNNLDDDCDGVLPPVEADGDGDGFSICEGDCDDLLPGVYPGAPEYCDGADQDCDSVPDEIDPDVVDLDGDGYQQCDDCDDGSAAINPGALELCNGIDDDCDELVDALDNFVADRDLDGAGDCADCDDLDPDRYPGALELCDGIDNDCDTLVDAADADLPDRDGDGYDDCSDCDDLHASVNPGVLVELCDTLDNDCDGILLVDETDEDGDGLPPCGGDCDDTLPTVYSGAPEICDGFDTDCDGLTPAVEVDEDGDLFLVCEGDCDDSEPLSNPGFAEVCDGVDNDCDMLVDDADIDIPDADGDSWRACLDCDETDPLVNPGAVELCDDGIDNDCNGAVDALGGSDALPFLLHAQPGNTMDLYPWDGISGGFGPLEGLTLELSTAGQRLGNPVVGDFDEDGFDEVFTQVVADDLVGGGRAGVSQVVRWAKECGGGYESSIEPSLVVDPDQHLLTTLDANNDGRLDILSWDGAADAPTGTGTIWLQEAGGAFAAVPTPVSLHASQSLLVWELGRSPQDWDEDGNIDLFMCGHPGAGLAKCWILYGLGDGTFDSDPAAAPDLEVNFPISGIAEGDFDGDGRADVLLGADDDFDPGQVFMVRSSASGVLDAPVEAFDLNPSEEAVSFDQGGLGWLRAADLDDDGRTDVAIIWDAANFTTERELTIGWGGGDGSFLLDDIASTSMSSATDRVAPEEFAVPYRIPSP